jgi:hypothetical protein
VLAVLCYLLLLLLNKLPLTLLWKSGWRHLLLRCLLLGTLWRCLLLGTLWRRLLLGALWRLLLGALSRRLLLGTLRRRLLLRALRRRLLLRALRRRLLLRALRRRLLLFLLFLVLLRLWLGVGRFAHYHKQHRADYTRRHHPVESIDIHGTPHLVIRSPHGMWF